MQDLINVINDKDFIEIMEIVNAEIRINRKDKTMNQEDFLEIYEIAKQVLDRCYEV